MDAIINQTNSLNFALQNFKDNTRQLIIDKGFPNYFVTEGVNFALKSYYLQWFIRIIFFSQRFKCFSNVGLQIWQLQRISQEKLMVLAQNEMGRVIFRFKIKEGSFEYDFLKLLWVEGVLILPSETN